MIKHRSIFWLQWYGDWLTITCTKDDQYSNDYLSLILNTPCDELTFTELTSKYYYNNNDKRPPELWF